MQAFYDLYPATKHLHLLLIALSVLFFVVRFGLHMADSKQLDKKFFKIAPHVIDTFLLLSGVILCFMIKQYPLEAPWLTEKLMAVAAYILLAYMAIKSNRNRVFKIFAFLGAIGWLMFAAKLAVLKTTVLV
ncbi:invasion protein [Shewanella sp. SNU WT4]|uniref:SirB2 family protein n=1 Tax=Shewanella sp. SNU WT4 TaxID=2590015 RepID=UPI0011284923|nr:SirB2 family protein [Shewanella sp. SNU WT4]QDF67914.1 invasion protein [Shewanella sp. SNU WT4]